MTLLLVVLLALGPDQPAGPTEPFPATCTYVFDGDTIAVRTADGQELRVRYAGIDAPERDSARGRQATALNRSLVLDREVLLIPTSHQTDPYDRFLAHPQVCDIDVESALLAAGLARKWRE